jgi:hypothetical protein
MKAKLLLAAALVALGTASAQALPATGLGAAATPATDAAVAPAHHWSYRYGIPYVYNPYVYNGYLHYNVKCWHWNPYVNNYVRIC